MPDEAIHTTEVTSLHGEQKILSLEQNGHAVSIVLRIALCSALFLVIVGARWWLIESYGSDLPISDQWHAEAATIFKKYFDGTLTFGDLFSRHNEHRIFFTRLLAFALLLVSGQWDMRVQLVVNAVICAASACLLFIVMTRGKDTRTHLTLSACFAVFFSLPFGQENTLSGFQSQFYFLIGFSLAAIHLLLNKRAGSPGWVLGILCGGAALVSMGSGLLTAAAVGAVQFLQIIRVRFILNRMPKQSWATAGIALVLLLAGIVSSSGSVNNHDSAPTVGAFLRALSDCLSWPLRVPLWFLCTWLPFVVLVKYYISGRVKDGIHERLLLGTGVWVILQSAALAYLRVDHISSSRYADVLAFGLLVNMLITFCCLLPGEPDLFKKARYTMALWLVVNGIFLIDFSSNDMGIRWKHDRQIQTQRLAAYIATDDAQYLKPIHDRRELPFLAGQHQYELLLRDPSIQRILPSSVQKTLPLKPFDGSPEVTHTDPLLLESGILTPDHWERAGRFSSFVDVPGGMPFYYGITKRHGFPFLYLSSFGAGKFPSLTVRDVSGKQRRVYTFASKAWWWKHAIVYCPTDECFISGVADPAGAIITEPKELGTASVIAMTAAELGRKVFSIGAASLIMLLIIGFAYPPVYRQDGHNM